MEFHDPTLIIGKVFGQESTVVKWNYQILGLHPVAVRQKVPILDFQSEFSMSKIIRIFLKKIFIEEYQFRRTFSIDAQFLTNCHRMETQNLVISFDYSWFLAKNLAF